MDGEGRLPMRPKRSVNISDQLLYQLDPLGKDISTTAFQGK